MVVAQLVERSLPTPEVRGSNAVIGNFMLNIYCQLYRKDENRLTEKRPGMARLKNKPFLLGCKGRSKG